MLLNYLFQRHYAFAILSEHFFNNNNNKNFFYYLTKLIKAIINPVNRISNVKIIQYFGRYEHK